MTNISIVVPVYNMEKYLEKSLNSFCQQTMPDIEIIIVDDGSKDNSQKIYEQFAKQDHRIKIIKKENAGVSEARNTGIDNARGEFLMFADPDDWMEPKCCEVMLSEQKRTDADLVLADLILHKNGTKENYHLFSKEFTTSDKNFIKQYQKTCIGYCFNPLPPGHFKTPGLGSPWNKLFKKSIIDKYNLRFDPYVKGIYDDNLFTLYYLMHVNVLSYIQMPIYNYVLLTGSITRSYKQDTLDINERIFKKINDFIDETNDRPFFEEAFQINVIRRLTRSVDVYFFASKNPKSLSEKCRELKAVINSDPYYQAIRSVRIHRLNENDKLVVFLSRLNMPILICAATAAKRKIDKLKTLKEVQLLQFVLNY